MQFVLEIGLDDAEAGAQLADGFVIETGQRARHHVLGQRPEGTQRRRCLFGQIETMGPTVGRVVASLDETGRGQLVDEAAERDRRETLRNAEGVREQPIGRGSC